MWRLHINKHFETAPPASTAIHGPNKALLWHKDNTIGKQECMSWEKEGQGGSEGWCWCGRGQFKKQIIWCRSWAVATWLLGGLYGLWLSGTVCSKVMQVLKRPSEVTAFSLFLSLCGAGTRLGPWDTYITGPWQLHTYTSTQTHTELRLQAFCCRVLVHWSSSLLKDNKRAASQTGRQSVSQLLSASQ